MSFPTGVQTRVVSFGPAVSMETGDDLEIRISVRSTRSLVWQATGTPLIPRIADLVADPGYDTSIALPVTDQAGWSANGAAVDVSQGNQTHAYVANLEFRYGTSVVSTARIGPFAVPTGDLSTVDADTLMAVDPEDYRTIPIPDSWSTTLLSAQSAAASALAASETAESIVTGPLALTTSYNGTAWPSRASVVQMYTDLGVSFTGIVIWIDSTGTAPVPPDAAPNDLFEQVNGPTPDELDAVPYVNLAGYATGDFADTFNAADAATAGLKAWFYPGGMPAATKSAVPTHGFHLRGRGVSTSEIDFNIPVAHGYGIDVVHSAGLGGSVYDGSLIEELNLQGNADALIRYYGVGLQRLRRIVVQNSTSSCFKFDTCQDLEVSDIDVFSAGNDVDPVNGTGAVFFVNNSNNVYLNLTRVETPGGHSMWINNSGVKVFQGKTDGNAGTATPTLPFFRISNSGVIFSNYSVQGAQLSPFSLDGYTSFVLDQDSDVGASQADSVVEFLTPAHLGTQSGEQPGSIRRPRVEIRDVTVNADSATAAGYSINQLLHLKAPNPVCVPESGKTFVQLASTFVNGAGVLQAALTVSADGVTYVNPAANDLYTGLYLTNKTTGKRAKIFSQAGNLVQFLPLDGTTSGFSPGTNYRIEWEPDVGVPCYVSNVHVYANAWQAHSFKLFKQVQTGIVVTGASYSGTTFQTTVTTSSTLTANALVGYFLTDGVNNWLVRANTANTLTLDYDVSAAVVNGTYSVQAGKLWGGNGLVYVDGVGDLAGAADSATATSIASGPRTQRALDAQIESGNIVHASRLSGQFNDTVTQALALMAPGGRAGAAGQRTGTLVWDIGGVGRTHPTTGIVVTDKLSIVGNSKGGNTPCNILWGLAPGAADYALDYDLGAALHGGSGPGLVIAGFNMQNGGDKGILRLRGWDQFRIEQLFFQNSGGSGLTLDFCQDFIVRDIDIDGSNMTGGTNAKAIMVVTNSNNAYFNYVRIESPNSPAWYVAGGEARLFQGKIDANTTANTHPFVVVENGTLLVSGGFEMVASATTPIFATGRSAIDLRDARFTGNDAAALIVVRSPTFKHDDPDHYHGRTIGWMDRATVKLRDVHVVTQKDWDFAASSRSLIDAKAPIPDLVVGNIPGPGLTWKITGAFNPGTRVQFVLSYSTDGGSTWHTDQWIYDNLDGLSWYVVDLTTGQRAKIITAISSTGETWVNATSGFADGTNYRVEWAKDYGVPVHLDTISVQSGSFTSADQFPPFRIVASGITVSSVTYNSTTHQTTLATDGTFLPSGPALPPKAVTSGTGGIIAAGTHYYRVSAIVGGSETAASYETTVTTAGSTSSVVLSWPAVTSATGYRIYRSDGDSYGQSGYYAPSGTSTTFTDVGAGLTAGSCKPDNDLAGYFLTDGVHNWLVRSNTTSAIVLDFNVASGSGTYVPNVPTGAGYKVVAGKQWSGATNPMIYENF